MFFKRNKQTDTQANTLADEIKYVADTTGYENIHKNIDTKYNIIIERVRDLAARGWYRYEDNFSLNTHGNQMIYEEVVNRLIQNGFKASWREYGYSYLKIVVEWK